MFQVLLVDDEPLARNDVKSMLDWEKHGFTICGEANNGEAALSYMDKIVPHIVLLDVSMPSINGVELSGMIKERYPKVNMIMLSSYDDYDYVRTCLKNGAIDYLLKHRLNADTLLALLNKVVQNMQSEEREQEAREAQSRIIERLSPIILREHVANLARGRDNAGKELGSYAHGNGVFPQAVTYSTTAIQIVPFLLLADSLNDVQMNQFVQQTMEVMQMAIGDIHQQTVGYVGEGRFIILFSSSERSESKFGSSVNLALSNLSHSLEKFLNLKCVYSVGPIRGDINLLGESYSIANQKLNETYSQGTNFSKDALSIEEQKQLQLYLEQLESERVKQVISKIFSSVQNEPFYSMTVQMIVSELLRTIETTAKRYKKQILPRSELARVGSVSELEQRLVNIASDLIEAIKEQHAGSYSRHISKTIQFIADHYSSAISLEMAARALNLNYSYLSRLFKEEMKMAFSEYLNHVRIQSSCALMESGSSYSLKEICSQVGFSNYNYFFKVFKNVKGMTPQAYMDSLKQSKI